MIGAPSRRDLIVGGAGLALTAPGLAAQPLAAAPRPAEDLPIAEFAFEALVLLEPTREIGRTPLGFRRRVPIIGGTFQGPRIRGRVLPGGADWQLQRADDYTVIEADYMIEAEDGTPIHVFNRGLTNSRVKGAPRRYVRTVPQFEAPDGPHAWLNQSIFVGGLLPAPPGGPLSVRVRVFRLS
jgi:hypothetical protein